MAQKTWLSCLEKRDLLNQSAVSVETLLKYGEQYEEAGLVHDALAFYEKANAKEALERLMKRADEEGDLFLFNRLCRILNHEPGREEWLALAKRAEEAGKHAFAAEAYHRTGEEDLVTQFELRIREEGRTKTAPE